MKGWGDTKGREEASNWKVMRKEEGAQLTPLCGSYQSGSDQTI